MPQLHFFLILVEPRSVEVKFLSLHLGSWVFGLVFLLLDMYLEIFFQVVFQ